MHLERGEVAVGVHGQLGVGDVIAPVRVRKEALGALGGPLHRPADPLRRQQTDALLGVDEDLGAEAAAHVRRDDAQLVLRRDADERRDHQARDVRVLAGGVERAALGAAVVFGERGARLDRVRHQAIVDQIDLGDVRCAGDRLIDRRLVAELPLVDRVARDVVVDLRRALVAGVCGRRARRQLLVVDLEQLGRIARLMVGLRDHAGDGVADIADLALGEHRMGAGLHVRAVPGLDHPAADQIAPAGRLDVVAGEHREHAGRRRGAALVDAADPGVRMGRADEIGIDLAGPVDVVREVPGPGDEALVLLAPDRSADPVRGHRLQLLMSAAAALNGLDDVVVAGAAAEIAFQPLADLLLGGIRVALHQVDRAHDHAGRTEAALQPVMLAERRLHRVQLAVFGQAFDGRDLRLRGLQREHGAALHRHAVDVHDARAALAGVAADVGAGQIEVLA